MADLTGSAAESTQATPHVVYVDVEIPLRALTAEDSDPTLQVPSPLPDNIDSISLDSHAEPVRIIRFDVPQESKPGCILRLQVDGEPVDVLIPPACVAGDEINAIQDANLAWRAIKRTREFAALVPDDNTAPLLVHLPDGTAFQYEIPPDVRAGQIMNFQLLDTGDWTVLNACTLPEVVRYPGVVGPAAGPYTELLRVVAAHGELGKLPLDQHGVLHVSIPFCAGFPEYAVLGNFLADNCLSRPDVDGIDILATEVSDAYSFSWAVASRWYGKIHPRIRLHMCVRDLATAALPIAGLTVAMHPEVTKGGCWFPIVGSIVRSNSGLCVFGTFYEQEMQTVLNMVDMYAAEGTEIEVLENPYYLKITKENPDMRYIIMVRSPAVCASPDRPEPAK